MSITVFTELVKVKKTKKHKWAYAYKEPTEQKAICVKCGTEMVKSKVGGKQCTRYETIEGEIIDIHFGHKAPECK